MPDSIDLAPDEKLVIIPDIHNKYAEAEEIIREENPDRVVFLGDYFDGSGYTLADAANTAGWLAGSLRQKDRIHLVGNHDLNYMTPNPELKCSGYDPAKYEAIRGHDIRWDDLRLFCWAGDWLCTHAGMSNRFYEQQKSGESDSVRDVLERSRRDLESIHDPDSGHPFLQVGAMRGGACTVGGIVWCDYGEFEDIPGVRQIFGHTRDDAVRHKKAGGSEHYCIDTVLRHYAVYRAGAMDVRPSRHAAAR